MSDRMIGGNRIRTVMHVARSWIFGILLLLSCNTLTAANLRAVSASLNNVSPADGELISLRIDFATTSLAAGASYLIEYSIDGVPLSSAAVTSGAGQSSGTYFHTLSGWMVQAGSHTVEIRLDSGGAVSETDETDNVATLNFSTSAPSLPTKLQWPLAASQASKLTVVNYADLDPRSGIIVDYRGGPYSYNGHNGLDITAPHFPFMDAGSPIYAAASGTVTTVVDGNFDREISSNSNPANYISIDHGSGWSTRYVHLMRSSTAVVVGQTVGAGQLIGFMGSSGSSTDAHLHFMVLHNNRLVEPYCNIPAYFATPLPTYQNDQAGYAMDMLVTNAAPSSSDVKERPPVCPTFVIGKTWGAYFAYRVSHFKPGDQVNIRWYRPSGALFTQSSSTINGTVRYGYYYWSLSSGSWSQYTGTWQVALVVNGAELGRSSFDVVTSGGTAEILLRDSASRLIPNGRTTPMDFGSVAAGGAASQQVITVQNYGAATLTLNGISLPDGFSLLGVLPGSIASGASSTFTVALDSQTPGSKFGAVVLSSNDAGEGSYSFNVMGTVTGALPSGTPTWTPGGSWAIATTVSTPPALLTPFGILSDADSTNFNGGTLKAQFVSGGRSGDQLRLLNQGSGAGQVGIAGSIVSYGGVPVGTWSQGSATRPMMVALNANATTQAVQALTRAVAFANYSNASIAPRYVGISVTDETGKSSSPVYKTVISNFGTPLNQPPALAITGAGFVTTNEGQTATKSGTFSDPNGSATVNISATKNGFAYGTVQMNAGAGTWQWQADTTNGPNEGGIVTITASDNYFDQAVATFSLAVTNVPPTFNAGSDSTHPALSNFARTITFSDPGADVWSATADYGDGTGIQSLVVDQAQKTAALSHTYTTQGSKTVTVTISDADGGSSTDTFVITVLPPPSLSIQVSSDGVIPSGGTFSFPSLSMGTEISKIFTISNTGAADLTLGTVILIGGANGNFSIVNPPASLLPVGGSTTMTLRFTPVAHGTQSQMLRIPSHDGTSAPFDIMLSGVGAPRIPVVGITESSANVLRFEWSYPDAEASSVEFKLGESINLSSWDWRDDVSTQVGPNLYRIEIPLGEGPRKFFRLRVTGP